MTLADIRRRYPIAGSVLRRVIDAELIAPDVVEGLSEAALARIEVGDTPASDVRLLLLARRDMRRRRYA